MGKGEHQWTQKEVEEDYINRFHNEQEIYTPKQTIRVGKMENITIRPMKFFTKLFSQIVLSF